MNIRYNGGDPTKDIANGPDKWYSTYVDYARKYGIPWEYGDYSKEITRAEYVHIFYAALPVEEYTDKNTIYDNRIPDVKMTDAYAIEIYTLYRAGILVGSDNNGTFNPNSLIRRSEVAVILSRMMDKNARRSITF